MLTPLARAAAAVSVAVSLAVAAPVAAQSDNDSLVSYHAMTPEVALRLAQAALEDCRGRGFQVAVAVVDRFGTPQVLLRDRFAGPHTPETATRKAYTAVSFRTPTTDLAASTAPGTPQSGARDIPGVLMLGGGLPINAGSGQLVGGVGISGAPSGEEDAACAGAGLAAVEMDLAF